jgi:hypothetical protein
MRGSRQITNYVYHLYGDDEIFLTEAAYSIGTLAKRINPQTARIILFTDRPERVRALPVTCESIAGEIDAMRGPSGFGYRVKLCCILKCIEKYPGNVIYLDCDTIARGPMETLAARLGAGQALMYKQEKLAGRFHQFEGFQTQLPGGEPYVYGPQSCMFNAGVVGLHRDNADTIRTALSICDALLLQGRRNHVCEQFAVSEAFRLAGLKILEAHPFVMHYYRGSAKRYMHHQFLRFAARSKSELWDPDRPIPYSYPRVQMFKWLGKILQ